MTSPGNRGWWGRGGASRKREKGVSRRNVTDTEPAAGTSGGDALTSGPVEDAGRVHRQLAATGAVPPLP